MARQSQSRSISQTTGVATVLRPQPGPQETFLSSPADIAIYGGAAGGGKSFALLLEPLRHIANPGFGAVIFRRTTPQIRNEGALWDESLSIYGPLGASPKEHVLKHRFPSGSAVSFAHLEHDKTVLNYHGSQIPLIGFDELTHFSAKQFWYMLSRNRSTCGVRPYIRATCNPDPDSFVARLIEWWIDQDTGYPILERSGKIRYFVRVNDELYWANSPKTLEKDFPDACWQEIDGERVRIGPKSLTFIAASVEDNKILMRQDPGYISNLNALPSVERERLKRGNWKVRDESASIIKAKWWQQWPTGKPLPVCYHIFSSYDTAFTEEDRKNTKHSGEPAHSARTTWGVFNDEISDRSAMILLEAWNGKVGFPELRKNAKKHSRDFGEDVAVIEKKASGQSLIQELRRIHVPTRGFDPRPYGDKEQRAHLATPMFQAGLVYYPDKNWAREVINHIASFPVGAPPSADYTDTCSQAVMYVKRRMWAAPPDEDDVHEPDPTHSQEWEEDNDTGGKKAAYG